MEMNYLVVKRQLLLKTEKLVATISLQKKILMVINLVTCLKTQQTQQVRLLKENN